METKGGSPNEGLSSLLHYPLSLLTKQTKVNMIVGLLTLEHSCQVIPQFLELSRIF